jgi:hypothetical protein
MTTGDMFGMMWLMTIQRYPKLAVIDDDNYVHAILACRTEEAQDDVLNRFLKSRACNQSQETNNQSENES